MAKQMRKWRETFDVPARSGANLYRLFLIGREVVSLLRSEKLALKLRDVRTEILREDNGTYAVACSALGVYSVGKTLKEAKRNFEDALGLHLSVVRDKARKNG